MAQFVTFAHSGLSWLQCPVDSVDHLSIHRQLGPLGPISPLGPLDPLDPLDPLGPLDPLDLFGPLGSATRLPGS